MHNAAIHLCGTIWYVRMVRRYVCHILARECDVISWLATVVENNEGLKGYLPNVRI